MAGQLAYILEEQWNNNSPKFHFRLKEEMLDYYHDIQHLIPGRGVAL